MNQLTTHNPQLTAILILGHGSPVAEANETLIKVAEAVKNKGGYEIVHPAFLQFGHPDFSEAVDILVRQGVQRVIVQPYFLYMGAHVRRDLPSLVKTVRERYSGLEITLAGHLGYHKKLVEIAVERIEETIKQGSGKRQRAWGKGHGAKGMGQRVKTPSSMPYASYSPLTTYHLPNQHPIEVESLRIIGEQLDASRFSPIELPIIKRVIHATADFEYADLIRFGNNPIGAGLEAILRGADIITDVRMVEVGINRDRLDGFGGRIRCFVSPPTLRVRKGARDGNITRTAFAMRKASRFIDGSIIVIGNSPTALMELIGMIKDGKTRPTLVIGVPVGFVGAEASKDELMRLPIPYISIRGKKGGSTVAVAIVNALLMMTEEKLHAHP